MNINKKLKIAIVVILVVYVIFMFYSKAKDIWRISDLATELSEVNQELEDLQVSNELEILVLKAKIDEQKSLIEDLRYLEFTVQATAYCAENYPHICNNGDSTKTATGTTPTPNRTLGVNPEIIPYGTKLKIDGIEYTAEDTGGAFQEPIKVDILFATHAEAIAYGKQQKTATIDLLEGLR